MYDWAGRILGGLAALIGLALFVTLLGQLGKVFAWFGGTFWVLMKWLNRLVRSPRLTLLEGVERSALFAIVAFPLVWLYEKLRLRPKLKKFGRQQAHGTRNQVELDDRTQAGPPPWNEAPSLAALTLPPRPVHAVPAPLAELVRLWEAGFDIQPLFDLPSSETFIMSFYVYPQLWEAESPAVLVEAAKPLNDRPRWRLALRSGKDVLCVEIDEAELLAWWRLALGEIGLADWVGLYELIRNYCAQSPHDYPRWLYTRNQASTHWRQGLSEWLAAYHEAVLHATSWGNSVSQVALWQEELAALYRPLPKPDRDWATNELRVQTDWAANLDHQREHTQPIRLIDLLQTDHGVSALLDRLHEKSMWYGYKEVLDCLPEWVWTLHGDRPVCLPLQPVLSEVDGSESRQVHFPDVWRCDGHRFPDEAPPLFQGEPLIVANAEGLRGLVGRDGRFILPCRYAYLVNASGDGGCFEVAETLTQDRRGELLCDLIACDGKRINPAGIKALAGTCQQTGCVVTMEDERKPLRFDWMDIAGAVRNGEATLSPNGLRWAAVGNVSEGLRLVRCPDSGLWGYLNASGTLTISPRFRAASWFKNGLASAGLEEGRLGLIQQDGTWRIAPDWAFIAQEDDGSFLVRNCAG